MLNQINIHSLRNIDELYLNPHPRFNFFYGPNGSGKTSILEAVYLLGSGYSFRTRETAPLIQQGRDSLTVFSKTQKQDTISIQKNLQGATLVRLNQQPCQRSSDLAHLLPCVVFYHDLFQIIDAGPSVRRNILDWGLFHVEHSYHALWKEYRSVLKQRNALLRQRDTNRQNYLPWDKLLVDLAYAIDALRKPYFQKWSDCFQGFLPKLTSTTCQIQYDKGWDRKETGKSLQAILNDQFEQDIHRQYTYAGPQHADVLFDSELLKARQHLSRGQQKIILIALKLAQAAMIPKPCVYLMDDITIELDSDHIQKLFTSLEDLPGQFFLTSVSPIEHFSSQQGNILALATNTPDLARAPSLS